MKRLCYLICLVVVLVAWTSTAFAQEDNRVYYELIRYKVLNNSQMSRLEEYWKIATIPALNRLGIEPIGVFKPKYGSHGLDLYVLIPHKDLESFTSTWDKISHDTVYQKDGAAYIETDISAPLYYRFDTSLLRAFSHMPKPEIPAHIQGKDSRIFEMRTYESHSRQKAELKIEMFNEGGEIALFNETGLQPIFFAETLAGNAMPNLVYMLGFENMEERDLNWQNFSSSEGWQNLRILPRYLNTVSSVTDIILTPASYSQM
ncbi:NIPSNAP family protein [bacterium]|nr:NIPSNAP family protein [bacterium]